MITGVAPFCQRVGRTLTLEIRARDIVEQQLIFQIEEVSQSLPQVPLQFVFVRQEMVQSCIEPVGVDLVSGNTQEIIQGGATIPGIFDVQLAGWLAEPGDSEHGSHLGPGNLLTPRGHDAIEQHIQLKQSPKAPGQPDVTETTKPLEADVFKLDQHGLVIVRLVVMGRIEKGELGPGTAFPTKEPFGNNLSNST